MSKYTTIAYCGGCLLTVWDRKGSSDHPSRRSRAPAKGKPRFGRECRVRGKHGVQEGGDRLQGRQSGRSRYRYGGQEAERWGIGSRDNQATKGKECGDRDWGADMERQEIAEQGMEVSPHCPLPVTGMKFKATFP